MATKRKCKRVTGLREHIKTSDSVMSAHQIHEALNQTSVKIAKEKKKKITAKPAKPKQPIKARRQPHGPQGDDGNTSNTD